MGGADQFRGASKLRACSGRRDLRNRLAAPHQRSGIGLEAGASFDRYGFAGEHGLVEQDRLLAVRRTSAATTAPSDSFTISPGTSSAAGTIAQTPSRRTDAFSASRDFSAARVAWARALLEKPERRVEHQQTRDDRGLDVLAERQSGARSQLRASREPAPRISPAPCATDAAPCRAPRWDRTFPAGGEPRRSSGRPAGYP